jgi:hypothetical protein
MFNERYVLSKFKGVESRGRDQYQALCPAHDDNNPSLSIKFTPKRVLMYCHAGCTFWSVATAAGLNYRDLFANRGGSAYE